MSHLKVSHGLAGRTGTIGRWKLTEARYAPGQRLARHEHALPSWTFATSGDIEEEFSKASFIYGVGAVVTKPATADHTNRYGPRPASCLLLEIAPDAEVDAELTDNLFVVPRLFRGGIVPRLLNRIHTEWAQSDTIAGFSLECLLLELRLASVRNAELSRTPSSRRWLNGIRDHLEAEFRSPPSLSELARLHNLHPAYICQEFRSTFGVRIGDFVRNVRFEWAREAVASGIGSLTDVALAAGFSDQSHLSRDFRRRLGVSPRRFRHERQQRLKPLALTLKSGRTL